MKSYFLKLCWKNIWRNRRRTLITVNAIGLGVMSLVALRNYYDCFHEQVVQNVIRYTNGHLVISAPGYHDNRATSLNIKDTTAIQTWLQKNADIKAWSQRVTVNGLLSSARGSANIIFVGVEPEREPQVTRFSQNVTMGKYFEPGKAKQIVVGRKLAELLQAEVGSKVVALTQGVDGSIGNELFYVSGIFETQSDADKGIGFISISEARSLASLAPESANQIAVVLGEQKQIEKVKSDFAAQFSEGVQAKKLEILSWMEVQRHIRAMIELDKAVNRLLMIIILCVAALGIGNSILMSIMERTREFGVMMAIGTRKKEIISMVVVETLMISIVGIILGNSLGIAIVTYFGKVGFDLKWLTAQKLVIDGTIIQTVSYPTVQWMNSFSVTIVILLLTMVVAILPARHISKLNPVQALRAN